MKNWTFKNICDFLKDYGFKLDHIKGSHYFYYGRIRGEDVTVQAISNSHERTCQSDKTLHIIVKHSHIQKEYFEEWQRSRGKAVHKDIIG